nr:hypothetical protein [Pseudolysobacter antarcticus]
MGKLRQDRLLTAKSSLGICRVQAGAQKFKCNGLRSIPRRAIGAKYRGRATLRYQCDQPERTNIRAEQRLRQSVIVVFEAIQRIDCTLLQKRWYAVGRTQYRRQLRATAFRKLQ